MIQLLITEAQQPGDPAPPPSLLRDPRERAALTTWPPCRRSLPARTRRWGGQGGQEEGACPYSLREAKLAQGPGHHASSLSLSPCEAQCLP